MDDITRVKEGKACLLGNFRKVFTSNLDTKHSKMVALETKKKTLELEAPTEEAA